MSKTYRKPTLAEIGERVSKLRFAIGSFCYLVLGVGGHFLGNLYIYDAVYVELFDSVWWIPSGIASFAISQLSTNWILASVEVKE